MTPRTLKNGYSGKQPGFQNMVFLSLIFHLVLITIVLISVPTASRRLTFGPVYSVSLVGPEIASPRSNESSLMQEIEKSNEAASSTIFRRQIGSVAATPAKKEETNRSNIEKAISFIKQKELSTPEKSPSAKAAGGQTASSRTKATSTAGNANSQEYAGLVWAKIQKNWTLPPTLMSKNIEAVVAVRITRSGSLEYANLEKRSGNSYFDDAALKAVKKSSPFPPFPGRMTDSEIEIGIRFYSSRLR